MNQQSDDIYKEELMEIFKNPVRRGVLNDADVSVGQTNPMCGDEINVQLKIKDGVIKDAKFDGSACMVSVVSGEVLLDYLIGKTLDEAKNISKDKLLELLKLNLTTSRVACATLALNAVQKAILDYEKR